MSPGRAIAFANSFNRPASHADHHGSSILDFSSKTNVNIGMHTLEATFIVINVLLIAAVLLCALVIHSEYRGRVNLWDQLEALKREFWALTKRKGS